MTFGCLVLFSFPPRLVLTDIAVTFCSVLNFRIPVPVSGSGQFEMRRQSSELFLDGALSPPCQRMGAMVAFQCFDDFKRSVPSMIFVLLLWQHRHAGQNYLVLVDGLLLQEF